jgi:cell division protein FtsQ
LTATPTSTHAAVAANQARADLADIDAPYLKQVLEREERQSPDRKGVRTRPSKNAKMEHVLPTHARLARRGRALLPSRTALRSLRNPSRRQLALALLAALLLGGGFLWFRSSSFVAVEHVDLGGVSGTDASAVEAALIAEAKKMSTMDVSVGALEASVARFHVVAAIDVKASFPHSLAIDVTEQLPVAVLSGKAGDTAVAADGVVLGPALASSSLAKIDASAVPRSGSLVHDARLRSYLTVLGATPTPLLPLVKQVYDGKEGITAKMKGGLLVYFGNASRPHAKWASLAAVLANRESAGAIYVDVRVPERPAAGMPSSSEAEGEAGQVSATDPTSALLAESLARAVNGESPIEAVRGEASTPTSEVEEAPATTEEAPTEEAYASEATTTEAEGSSEASTGFLEEEQVGG